MRQLNLEDVEDILYGAGILGSGGGGSIQDARDIIIEAFKKETFLKLIDINNIADEALVVSPYYIGSPKPFNEIKPEELLSFYNNSIPTTIATKKLNQYFNGSIQYICATELGGNIAWAIYTSMTLGLPLIDGDPAGRAVPELEHTTFKLKGHSMSPFALANQYGEYLIFENVINHNRGGIISSTFAKMSGNFAGICDHPLTGKQVKSSVIMGTVSRALKIGNTYRLNKSKDNCLEKIIDASNGNLIAEAEVISIDFRKVENLLKGKIILQTKENEKIIIYFVNENMWVSKNNQTLSIIPNIITMIDTKDFQPKLNPYIKKGESVYILSIPASDIWYTPEGSSLFGEKYVKDHIPEYSNLNSENIIYS